MEESKAIAVKDWDDKYLSMLKTLRRYVTQLQNTLPKDQLNRPLALVNPQVVQGTGFRQAIDQFIDSPPREAILPVSYLEGLPTIFGNPIWEKLEGEKLECYELFKRYRAMHDAKVMRSVYKLHLETGVPVSTLELLRQIYQWQIRVQAYDEYVAREREIALELRRREIEGKHATAGSKLFKVCTDYLEQNIQMLNPKTALEMLELAIKLERVSAGMLPDRPGTTTGGDRPTINIQNNVVGANTASEFGTGATGNLDEDKNRLKQMLNIMNNVGIIKREMEPTVIDVDVKEEGEE